MPVPWASMLSSVLEVAQRSKMSRDKAVKSAVKLAVKQKIAAKSEKNELFAEVHELLQSGQVAGFQIKGDSVRRSKTKEKKEDAREVLVPSMQAAEGRKEAKKRKKEKEEVKEKKRKRDNSGAAAAAPSQAAATGEVKKRMAKDELQQRDASAAANAAASEEKKGAAGGEKIKRRKKASAIAPTAAAAEQAYAPAPATAIAVAPPTAALAIGNPAEGDSEPEQQRWRASHQRDDVKSGAYSASEKAALRGAVEAFARSRGFSTSDYSWLMASRGHRGAETLGVWKEVARALPQRTIKSVASAGNRMFHPDANKGKWSAQEDADLVAAVEAKGNAWAAIATQLGRTREACRVRWREIRLGDKRAHGTWQEDEVQRLLTAVNEYLEARKAEGGESRGRGSGSGGGGGGGGEKEKKADRRLVLDDIDWGVVSTRVGTRSNVQCLEKWYDQLSPSMVARGDWGAGDDRRMLRALWGLAPVAEYTVPWGELVGGRTAAQARRRWRLMSKAVPQHRDKEFFQVVEALVTKYLPHLKEREQQGAMAAAMVGGAAGGGGKQGSDNDDSASEY